MSDVFPPHSSNLSRVNSTVTHSKSDWDLHGRNGYFQWGISILITSALVKRWGAKRMYQVAICAYFPLWALFLIPVSTVSADYYPWSAHLLACIGVMLVAAADITFSKHSNLPLTYPMVHSVFIAVIFLFVRSAAPTPAALGTTNGLAQTMASLMRAIGPLCTTCLYAVSREYKLLGGQLVYIVLALVTAVAFSASFLLPLAPRARHT
jgi:MFS family permease